MDVLGRKKRKNQKIEEMTAMLDMNNLPRHIAVIMDGNGRWARKKKLPRAAGHKVGIKSVHKLVDLISLQFKDIEVLTLYAFSTENWFRPIEEVNILMKLLVDFLRAEIAMMERNKVRFQTIGHIEGLPALVREEVARTIERTKNNEGLLLNIALNYSSQVEITDAARNIALEVKSGKLDPGQIDETLFRSYLYTADLPDPDLLIRTSGEMRISNFLLWQLAYSELWLTPTLWPDFREPEFIEALLSYQKRERRFGRVGKKL